MSIVEGLGSWLAETFSGVAASKDGSGAYWCRECDERLSAHEVDAEHPSCPSCGGVMDFEREPPARDCC